MKKSIIISVKKVFRSDKSFYLRIPRTKENVKALNALARFQAEYDTWKPVSESALRGVIENPTCWDIQHACWKACNPGHSCTWRVCNCKSCPARNYDTAAYIWRQAEQ